MGHPPPEVGTKKRVQKRMAREKRHGFFLQPSERKGQKEPREDRRSKGSVLRT